MKFIMISDSMSVNKEEIICVEGKGDNSYVTTISGVYETNLPYATLMKMIESDNPNNNKMPPEGIKRWDFGNGQHFAG